MRFFGQENYSKTVLKHFKNPHNYGSIKDADAVGKVGNPRCGDVMWLYLKVKPSSDIMKSKIADIKFETFGCVAAIATSSMITDLAKKKTINEAMEITKDNIVKRLGYLPAIKMHCSVLAIDALHEAIYQYLTAKKIPVSKQLKEEHKRIEAARKSGAFEHKH